MDTNGIAEAIRAVLAQAQHFAVPCALIIAVTMGVIMAWDLLRALGGSVTGRKPPRGKRHDNDLKMIW